ncbi:MAG: hypothetical protein V1709_00325 [Planctomycetota bacterium]
MKNEPYNNLLKKISGYLWSLIILDSSFKTGSYLIIVSIILLLISKITNILFLSQSYYWLLISPLIGLSLGLVIGLFRKPSVSETASVIDTKLGLDNYLSTTLECIAKQSPNQIEQSLADNIKKDGINHLSRFSFVYNWRAPSVFMILAGITLIIWFTPVAHSGVLNKLGVTTNTFSSPEIPNLINISQGLSEIKQNTATNQDVQELIRQIETLLNDIQNTQQNYSILLEKINRFIQEIPKHQEIPHQESARLQSLLQRLESLVNVRISNAYNVNTKGGESNGFSRYQPESQQVTKSPQAEYNNKIEEVQPDIQSEPHQEPINNPYWPEEYNEIIKKYFSKE